jgi:hypothetical protein
MEKTTSSIYGLMAQFDNPTTIVEAANKAYQSGYRRMDAFSPFPIEELSEAIGFKRNMVSPIVFTGGLIGFFTALGMLYYLTAIDYPLNVGGRPLGSWPAFIPITFELTVLFASLSAVFGMLLLNGFPRPHHPVFNIPSFDRASQDRFFLLIEADDPKFDIEQTRSFLQSLNPVEVSDVEY